MTVAINRRFFVRGLVLQWLGALIAAASLFFDQERRFFLPGAFLFLLGWVLEIMSRGNITFWAKVKDYPDLAYDWFKSNDNWIVMDDVLENASRLLQKKDWVGPFHLCVPKLEGKIVRIYGKANGYEKTQEAFLRLVQTAEN